MADNISLDELVALNDEIAGLVRAGMPLDLGLAGWGRRLRGRLGRLATQLSQSVQQGKTLAQSLDESAAGFPPMYRAVVMAGIQSGRLPAALESLAASARNLQRVRRTIGLAILYPLVLFVLGYFTLWLLVVEILPVILGMYEGNPPPLWAAIVRVGALANTEIAIPGTSRVILAGFVPPVIIVLLVAVWWLTSRRAMVLGGGATGWVIEWLPLAGRAVRHARIAAVAEILGLLVEQGVPLGDALVLAAECTADRRLVERARALSRSLAGGGAPPSSVDMAGFPPLLAWLVSSGGSQQTFVSISRHVADTYRRRIARESRWLQDYLPMWLVAFVGGGLIFLIAIVTYLPFVELMDRLADSIGQSLRIHP